MIEDLSLQRRWAGIVVFTLLVVGAVWVLAQHWRHQTLSAVPAVATTTTTAVPTTYDGFADRNACMQASWTTVAGCQGHFSSLSPGSPACMGSWSCSPTTSYPVPSYRSSDPLQQSCGFLRDVGPSGDPSADRLRSAVLNNYC